MSDTRITISQLKRIKEFEEKSKFLITALTINTDDKWELVAFDPDIRLRNCHTGIHFDFPVWLADRIIKLYQKAEVQLIYAEIEQNEKKEIKRQ